ncbi:MAG: hypothetical protein COA58_12590 [Bacteroidetes bacterium]|nr:MAG: hypothetical protein COA58_12590 [Bacteroidota bacterium]
MKNIFLKRNLIKLNTKRNHQKLIVPFFKLICVAFTLIASNSTIHAEENPYQHEIDSLLELANLPTTTLDQRTHCIGHIIFYYKISQNPSKAISLAESEIEHSLSNEQIHPALFYMSELEIILLQSRKMDKATALYLRHLKLLETHLPINHTDSTGYIRWSKYYNSVAYLKTDLLQKAEAVQNAEQSVKFAYLSKNMPQIILTLRELGFQYNHIEDYDNAIDSLNKALKLVKIAGKTATDPILYKYLGDAYRHQKKYQKALEMLFKSSEYKSMNTNPERNRLMMSLVQLSAEAKSKQINDYIITQLNFSTFPDFIDSANTLCNSIMVWNEVLPKASIEALEAAGYYKEALKYFPMYIKFKNGEAKFDSTLSEAGYESKLALYEKEKETALLKSQNLLYLVVGLFFLLAVLFLLFLRRVTNRKNKIIQIQNEELRTIDQLKTQFFTNVSHELRTPLTLILGPIEHLLTNNNIQLSEVVRNHLKLCFTNAGRLKSRVDEILDLSKLETGKLELDLKSMRFNDFVKKQIQNFESQTITRQIRVNLISKFEDDFALFIDIEKTGRIFDNILSNAIKHSPNEGSISIRLNQATDRYSITIEDNGNGVEQEEREQIFDRFYQSKQGKNMGGTGIGLALSRQLARLMDGDIVVLDNKTTNGACFEFQFKADQVIAYVPESISDMDAVFTPQFEAISEVDFGSRPSILIVEDNLDLKKYLLNILQKDYKTYEANNGDEALKVLEKTKIDLITSDIMMPNMDGFEFLTKLKQHEEYRYIPIIMITAKAGDNDKLTALELGVDDYLIKPFFQKELQARIRNLLTNLKERIDVKTEEDTPIDGQELWLKKLNNFIISNLDNSAFGIDDICEEMAIAERTLYRHLKKLIGLTPAAYIKEIKLNKALKLLQSKTYSSVKEVTVASNFSSTQYFATEFYKRYGKKPSEYF